MHQPIFLRIEITIYSYVKVKLNRKYFLQRKLECLDQKGPHRIIRIVQSCVQEKKCNKQVGSNMFCLSKNFAFTKNITVFKFM